MKRILAHILPMKLLDFAFTDVVSGKCVYYWQERITGRVVLAEGALSFFRVEVRT